MYTLALLTTLLSLCLANPLLPRQAPLPPNVNVTLYSTSDCSHGLPSTTRHAAVIAGPGKTHFPCDSYSSLIINHISDHFIGQNAALQIGSTATDTVDFTDAVKFSIADRKLVGKCQFVGIPQGMGKPLGSGNEYRITTLQG